ncbi:M2 family metallopeptidase [candidate division KSB1 bacterium]|nr:M2 family metallopeptidase [candidate division KSB1 bacterium]
MHRIAYIVSLTLVAGLMITACTGYNDSERQLAVMIEDQVVKVQPLMRQQALSGWQADSSGLPEAYARQAELEMQLRTIYSDSVKFRLFKSYHDSEEIHDPLLKRQAAILYQLFQSNQIKPDLLKKIVDKSTAVRNKFNTFRGKIGSRRVSNSEIQLVLQQEVDSKLRKNAWIAGKQVGRFIANDVIELVKLRNEAARDLGFENYYIMSLTLSDQNLTQLTALFDDLDALTREPFLRIKSVMDSLLAKTYRLNPNALMPWHYQDLFFQEAPQVTTTDLNGYYSSQDIVKLAHDFFRSIDLDVTSILDASDLYAREGKYPHAYCEDIDRYGDVRIMANLSNDSYSMETLLHELGHAVYDAHFAPDLPFLLRQPAHSFITEGIAIFFERMSLHPSWFRDVLKLNEVEVDTITEEIRRNIVWKRLVFARWAQVMFRFEQELYRNPDQDLNNLWWDLVQQYQLLNRPPRRNEPDWATKIHLATYPAYYHNYVLGELFASQLTAHINKSVIRNSTGRRLSYYNQPDLGRFLMQRVFKHGARYEWEEQVKKITGESLTATYFAQQFIQ